MPRPIVNVENLPEFAENEDSAVVDVLMQVATPPMLHVTKQGKQFVTFDCGDADCEDIFNPDVALITVFIWLGSRRFEEFRGVVKGDYVYARKALLSRKYKFPNEKQIKMFDNTLLAFYKKKPAWHY